MRQRILFIVLAAITLSLFFRFYFHRNPKAEDVEINVKEEKIAPGSLRFEGTITNTSTTDISKAVVAAEISELSFKEDELHGCWLVSPIAEIRNLKAGETRAVIWYFNQGKNQLRCGRQVYRDRELFDYTVYWGEG